jgi:hypothetical protein
MSDLYDEVGPYSGYREHPRKRPDHYLVADVAGITVLVWALWALLVETHLPIVDVIIIAVPSAIVTAIVALFIGEAIFPPCDQWERDLRRDQKGQFRR